MKTFLQTAAAVALAFGVTAAHANDELVLYTSQPNKYAQQTVDAFTKANPDIDVKWVRDGTTKLMTKLRAEIAAGQPKPDVLLIADMVTLEGMKRDGNLQPYKSPERKAYDAALYDQDGYYYSTKLITSGIIYNTKGAKKPSGWQDLAEAKAKNLVAMPSPLYSGAALIHLSTLTENDQLGWDYYKALQSNGVNPQGGNGGVYKAVASGEKLYGVVVDFLAIRGKAKGANVDFVFPPQGVSMVTEPVAIMKTARNVEPAKRFVDFLLSNAGQKLVLDQGYIPARADMPVPAGFPARDEIKLMSFDPAVALDKADENKKRFSDLFGAK